MKRLEKFMGIGIAGAVLLSGLISAGSAVPVLAAEDISDSWDVTGGMKKTVITDESFDSGFVFAEYNTLENGTWEAFCGSSGDDGKTVSLQDGKVVLTPGEGIPSGIRFKYPATKGITVFAVTANRHGDSKQYGDNADDNNNSKNKLKLNVRYDAENQYSYKSGHGSTTAWVGMDPARESPDGTNAAVEPDYSRSVTGYFMVQTGNASVRRKYLNSNSQWSDWYTRAAAVNSEADPEEWDTLELFSIGAPFEIESVKVINYSSPGPIYMDESFDEIDGSSNEAVLQGLAERGIGYTHSVTNYPPGEIEAVWDGDSQYLKLGKDGSQIKGNGSILINLPGNLPSEFYLTARLRAAVPITGDDTTGNVVMMYVDIGSKRYELHNTRLNRDAYTDGNTLITEDEWSTMIFHAGNDGTADLYVLRNGQRITLFEGQSGIPVNARRIVIYGALCVDDLRIFEPGIYFNGAEIKSGSEGTVGRLRIMGETEDQEALSRKITGILAIYDKDGVTRAAAYTTAEIGDVLEDGGTLAVYIDALPIEAAYARFYLWDGIGETEMQPLDELTQVVRAEL